MSKRTTSPPAVLLVTDSLSVGGLERIVVDLANGLAARGHRVGVLAAPGGLEGELSRQVDWYPLDPRHGLRGRAVRIRTLVQAGRYELVHAHQRGVALAARLGTVRLDVPVVEHVHNVFAATLLARLLSFRGHLLLACGSAVADMLVERFGRPRARVRLVRNGIRDPFAAVPGPAGGGSVLRIVGAGRLTDQKDPLRFVLVVAGIAARLPEGTVRAEWLGDGPLLPDVRAAVAAAGLQDVIDLPGLRSDAAAHIASADLLLSTSRWEGLPLVALEALAAGRGIVLPDVGSCVDAVVPGVGLLYDPLLPDDRIADLVVGHVLTGALARWSVEGRRRYETTFTFDRVLDEVQAAYREVARSTHRPVEAAEQPAPRIPAGEPVAAGSER
jgi:glycosyltransferase involved in cell wall biosynthesis